MTRLAKDLVSGALFNRNPKIHDHYLIGYMLNYREIMANKEVGEVQPFLQLN